MVLRSFLVAQEDSYVVMPGGLTRVSPSLEDWVVSNQRGGTSKDTWVLASEPEREVSLLASAAIRLMLFVQAEKSQAAWRITFSGWVAMLNVQKTRPAYYGRY